MGVATSFTADRMLDIEQNAVIGGSVDANGEFVLRKKSGATINAGNVATTAIVTVNDSDTIDLSLSGVGTPADPWDLRADIKALPNSIFLKGFLEPSYRGGRAKVKVDGVLSSNTFEWMAPYNPQESREVRLMKVDDTFIIVGQDNSYRQLLNINVSAVYSYNMRDGSFWASPATITQLKTGMVILDGLLAVFSGMTTSTVIATLPDNLKPDFDVLFPVEVNAGSGTLRIRTNGNITLESSAPGAGGYISISGVWFWPSNTADWVNIGTNGTSFGAKFQATMASTFGPPAVYKDEYGFVWFRGMVTSTVNVTTDDTVMIDVTVANAPFENHHVQGRNNNASSVVGFNPYGHVTWKAGSNGGVGVWHTLAGVVGIPAESPTLKADMIRGFASSWTKYPGFVSPAFMLREDGLRLLKGFIRNGTVGNLVAFPSSEYRPRNGRTIFSSVCYSGGRVRVDLYDTTSLVHMAAVNSNNWLSLDSMFWVP